MTALGFDTEDFTWTEIGESSRKTSDTKYGKICKMAGRCGMCVQLATYGLRMFQVY